MNTTTYASILFDQGWLTKHFCKFSDYQPAQFKLSSALSRVLGIHTQTRAVIVAALWQYIKCNKLQDPDEREYVNNDTYLKEVFGIERMKFCEIPQRLQGNKDNILII